MLGKAFALVGKLNGDAEEYNEGITVERNIPETRVKELGIKAWPKWGCPPGKFPLKYEAEETCYLLKGRVKAYVKGSSPDASAVEFGAGDLVVLSKGLSCIWDVAVAVDKHYKFDSS
ncbi:hypothetical protein ZIOFF_064133 [Zingiber officinale]|uniref:(S)-ureidoglycine aminohydrolase cupin domain-containing protein n=1 Tax=Zingiber officinale TaxID=94328 RepID=A0A8J5CHZ6_ZINOF|nr:hypothetical protein ZIOFF_064133 [Zingiber officinale]